MKARYFKDGNLLNAGCPGGASYTWKSIIHGRKLLKEGLVWRLGNGQSVDVWRDDWIPRSSLKRPFGHQEGQLVERVCELLLPDGGGWNESKVCDVFH